MGGECSKHSETIMRTKFWSENLKGNNHSVTLCIDERILLNANIHVVVRWSSGLWHRVVIYWTISGKKKKDH